MKRSTAATTVLVTALAATGTAVTLASPWTAGEQGQAGAVQQLAADPARPPSPVTATAADEPAAQEPLSGSTCPDQLSGPLPLVPGVSSVVSRSCGANSAVVEFAIAGKANAATGSAAAQQAGDLSSHPASYLRLVTSFPTPGGPPGWKALPAPLVADDSVTITQTSLAAGLTARVTNPVKNNGLVRVEWIQNGTYYQLLSDRGWTPDGATGLPASTVIAMAKTLT